MERTERTLWNHGSSSFDRISCRMAAAIWWLAYVAHFSDKAIARCMLLIQWAMISISRIGMYII